MRLANQVAAVLLLLLGLYMIRQAAAYGFLIEKVHTGPGFMPMLTGGAIALLSIILFVGSFRWEPTEFPEGLIPDRIGLFRVGAIIASMAVLVVTLEPLGFRLAMLPFLFFLILAMGRQNLLLTTAIALVGSFGLYWVFVHRLMVYLPEGFIGF